MPMTTVDHVLERARSALGRSTLYWLGQGGKDPAAPLPSSPLAVGRLWPTLPAAQRMELEPVAAAQGIDVHDPGLVLDACDCSGYVCWALGLPRHVDAASFTDSGGWIYTDSIWADAMGPGTAFQRLAAARPGALMVYPRQGSPDDYGHVGIVIEADTSGRATLVAHCSAANLLAAPFDAIKITPPELFKRSARTIYAWYQTINEG
jgi:hypothetical protein